MTLPLHYRIFDQLTGVGVCAFLETYRAIRKTPEGFWVVPEWSYLGEGCTLSSREIRKRGGRWVSAHSTKRYCYPSLEQAITSFEHRKKRQASILVSRAEVAKVAAGGAHRCRGAKIEDFRNGLALGELFDFGRLFG